MIIMGKKKVKPKKTPKIYSFYKEGKTEKQTCPKCGSGVFMAGHKDRQSCGKCGYTLFSKK